MMFEDSIPPVKLRAAQISDAQIEAKTHMRDFKMKPISKGIMLINNNPSVSVMPKPKKLALVTMAPIKPVNAVTTEISLSRHLP